VELLRSPEATPYSDGEWWVICVILRTWSDVDWNPGWIEAAEVGLRERRESRIRAIPELDDVDDRFSLLAARALARLDDNKGTRSKKVSCKRKPGRPRTSDPQGDEHIARKWSSKMYKRYVDLARELGCTAKAVKEAIDRHRHRQSAGRNT
jgi:hypothetical protein